MENDFPPTNPPSPTPAPPPPTPPPLALPARKPRTGRGWKIATLVLAVLLVLSVLSSFVGAFFDVLASAEGFGGEARLQEMTVENNHAADKSR